MEERAQAVGTVADGEVQSILSITDAGRFAGFQEWLVHLRFRPKGEADSSSKTESVFERFTISRRKAEWEFYRLKQLYRMEEVPYGPPPKMDGEDEVPLPSRALGPSPTRRELARQPDRTD